MKTKHGTNERLTGQITENTKIIQCFIAESNKIKTIAIEFATYMRINNCNLIMQVVDLRGNVIYTDTKDCNTFADNKASKFSVDKEVIKGNKYKVVLTSNGSLKNAVTAKYGAVKTNHTFTINGKLMFGYELFMEIDYIGGGRAPKHKTSLQAPKQKITPSNKKTDKKVSIILNSSSKILDSQFKQIKNQTYKNIEIILIGNKDEKCDYDGTPIQIVKTKAISQKIIANYCSGEYILTMLESVFIDENSLKTIVETAKNNNVDMTTFSGKFKDKKVKFIWDKTPTDLVLFNKTFIETVGSFTVPTFINGGDMEQDLIEGAYLGGGTFANIEDSIVELQGQHRAIARLKSIPQNLDKKEIAIYTCITGDYENFAVPKNIPDNADFFCFTDSIDNITDMAREVAFLRTVESSQLNDVKIARMYKVLGHRIFSKYKYNIWIDGNMDMTENIADLTEYLDRNNNIALFKHPLYNCVYKEAKNCIALKKDDEQVIKEQVKKYKKEKYPTKNGMVETGVMVRDTNNQPTINLMEAWWKEIKENSCRDQLSFNYCVYKKKYKKLKIVLSRMRDKFATKLTIHR